MKFLLLFGSTFFISFLFTLNGWTQELISTSGDIFAINGLQLEWSLGELEINTEVNEAIVLTQGFHQPEIMNIREEESLIKVYPNPYDMFLIIELSSLESENMFCTMVDMSGKIISMIKNLTEYNEIITSEMSYGIYILHVYESTGRLVKSVKIIKLYQE